MVEHTIHDFKQVKLRKTVEIQLPDGRGFKGSQTLGCRPAERQKNRLILRLKERRQQRPGGAAVNRHGFPPGVGSERRLGGMGQGRISH